ncbi:HNH endonuclease family protein [Actinocatenispora sera]|uniref:HNH endonuclease family protein n=1 Tax=Actinocatenispora sera TaxID=390989 RepID=UPI0033D06E2B
MRIRTVLGAVAAAGTLAAVGVAGPAQAYPPTPPSASESAAHLATLTVAAPGSMDGYSRDKFPHWISQGDNCNTREVVLKRDGDGVTVGNDCYPTAGSWYSVYDQTTTTDPSKVQIDHIVPLADAWRSGAAAWTTAKRQDFANDLTDPQLIAVSASSNESKGDQNPSQWKPPNTGEWCYYARNWIQVKYVWKLTITSAEKSALSDMLTNHC